MKNLSRWKALGPGLLYAGAAVGVSHVVQSTRAGAYYGFALIGFVLLVNLIKYPFFEFATRYTAHTGNHLLQAYRKMGSWVLPAFLLLSLLTMFPILAAISAVFAGIAQQLLLPGLAATHWAAVGLGLCVLILLPGQYRWLDKSIKGIILLLSITTVVAVMLAMGNTETLSRAFAGGFSWNRPGWLFLIAFAGWMPTPIDASVWQSLWIHAKQKRNYMSVEHINFDFKLGYLITILLAVFFLMLGALVMFGSSTALPAGGAAFAAAFVHMYVGVLGDWAYPLIVLSVLTTMFSTLLTVLDAYPRVLVTGIAQYKPDWSEAYRRKWYWLLVLFLAVGALLIVSFFGGNMLALVDFSTRLSFLAAPVLAWWNLRLMQAPELPEAGRPKAWLRYWARFSLLLLSLFALVYLLA
ncbi:MAG: NRAMP family divalent metal transporter [Bacteroidia bacterium]